MVTRQKGPRNRRVEPYQVVNISEQRLGSDPRLSEEVHEHRNQVALDEPDEIIDDGEDATPRRWPSIPEDYLHGHLQVWVYLELGGGVSEGDAWLGVFERLVNHSRHPSPVLSTRRASALDELHCRASSGSGDDEHGAVLISDVQIVKKGKPSSNRRSAVRLYAVEHLPDVGPYVDIETWLLRPVLSDAIPLFEDGEGGAVGIVPLQPSQLAREMIERTSQVMDAIPEHGHKRIGNGGRIDGVIDVLKAIRLDLGDEGVKVTIRDHLQHVVQSLAVTLCPPHLEIHGVEIGRLRRVHATPS